MVGDIGNSRIRREKIKAAVTAAAAAAVLLYYKGNENGRREMCVTICFPQKAEPETRIWKQVVYLGGDSCKQEKEVQRLL